MPIARRDSETLPALPSPFPGLIPLSRAYMPQTMKAALKEQPESDRAKKASFAFE